MNDELALITNKLGRGWPVCQLLVGGGMPNYLADYQLIRLVSMLEDHFQLNQDSRRAIECNPARTSIGQLELLRGLGFSELRFEVRELDSRSEVNWGRSHSPELLADAISNARHARFERTHISLFYGLPGQTASSLLRGVETLIDIAPDEVNLVSFERREQEFYNQRSIKADALPNLADKLVFFVTLSDALQNAGYHWAGGGFFTKSPALSGALGYRNRLGFVGEHDVNVLGLGAGAVSDLPNLLCANSAELSSWRNAIARREHPVERGVVMTQKEAHERLAIAALAAGQAIDEARIATPVGLDLLQRLESSGLVRRTDQKVLLSISGRDGLPQFWDSAGADLRWFRASS